MTETKQAGIDRTSGVALWRQIADDIRVAIGAGEFREAGKLPGEMALAERFGVNRHTVRAAIAALQNEGIVKAKPGRGTEILSDVRLKMPISRRTRFSSGLGGQARRPESVYIASGEAFASRTSRLRCTLRRPRLASRWKRLALPMAFPSHWPSITSLPPASRG